MYEYELTGLLSCVGTPVWWRPLLPTLIILPDLITRTVWEFPMEAECRRSGSLIAVGRVAMCCKRRRGREGGRKMIKTLSIYHKITYYIAQATKLKNTNYFSPLCKRWYGKGCQPLSCIFSVKCLRSAFTFFSCPIPSPHQ